MVRKMHLPAKTFDLCLYVHASARTHKIIKAEEFLQVYRHSYGYYLRPFSRLNLFD